jgi:hypothetical protein
MLSASVRSLLLSCLLALVAFGLVGCGADPQAGSEAQDERPETWTVQEGALQLQENLRVSEGEDFFFGRIADAAVADDGRIYVVDNQAAHVKVLSPDGTLRDTVGVRGEGPGEFQHPLKLARARGDSLYVLDGMDGRVHVFAPGGAFERVFLARTDRGSPIQMMIPDGPEAGGPGDEARRDRHVAVRRADPDRPQRPGLRHDHHRQRRAHPGAVPPHAERRMRWS